MVSLLGVMKKEKLETSHSKSGMIDNETHYFNSFYPDLPDPWLRGFALWKCNVLISTINELLCGLKSSNLMKFQNIYATISSECMPNLHVFIKKDMIPANWAKIYPPWYYQALLTRSRQVHWDENLTLQVTLGQRQPTNTRKRNNTWIKPDQICNKVEEKL